MATEPVQVRRGPSGRCPSSVSAPAELPGRGKGPRGGPRAPVSAGAGWDCFRGSAGGDESGLGLEAHAARGQRRGRAWSGKQSRGREVPGDEGGGRASHARRGGPRWRWAGGRGAPLRPAPASVASPLPISRGRQPLHPRLSTPDPSRPSPSSPSPHQPAAQNLTQCPRQISVPTADFIPGPWRVLRSCDSPPWNLPGAHFPAHRREGGDGACKRPDGLLVEEAAGRSLAGHGPRESPSVRVYTSRS
ncbi:pH-response regulator protein palI/prr-5-like [Enhydra lutris kenyoni]|uniref:PH-response regulator protein palI/prr-5-like n=1 Tax=Enhydra lutris kenyoni TaxID=391180 RepID=A0A2Y9IH53_ENHLU|nr:pH-response regulator protein palI/prr-5-like [Enhydra lutris kenyoni]